METFTQRNEKNWNVVNTTTIVDWISSSNLNILLLDNYLFELRTILQVNTLWSLLISSVTSTISVTQFTVSDSSDPILSLGIKVIISVTSVLTSLITGYIKVEKIQETIESLEEHKQNWMKFMNSLTTELQVGCEFRSDANEIIKSKKDEFNTMNGKHIDIPDRIRQKVSQFLLQKQKVKQMLVQAKSCWPLWLSLSSCCVWTEQDYNVERLNIKLSFYHSINKNLKKELLDTMFCYPEQVSEIEFNQDSDLFIYKMKSATLDKCENKGQSKSTFTLRANQIESVQRLPASPPVTEEV